MAEVLYYNGPQHGWSALLLYAEHSPNSGHIRSSWSSHFLLLGASSIQVSLQDTISRHAVYLRNSLGTNLFYKWFITFVLKRSNVKNEMQTLLFWLFYQTYYPSTVSITWELVSNNIDDIHIHDWYTAFLGTGVQYLRPSSHDWLGPYIKVK